MYFLNRICYNKNIGDDSSGKTETEYIADAQSGSEAAFENLSTRYIYLLRWYIGSLNLPNTETEDLMQEGMIGLLKAVRSYDGVTSAFSTYAFHCMKNSIITAVRKYQRYNVSLSLPENLEFTVQESISTPESAYIDKENLESIYDNLFTYLSDYELKVFELYLSELTHKEIACALHKDTKSINNAVFRIRNKLKQIIADED